MASSLDLFVEMEGLRPYLKAAETLGWGLTLHPFFLKLEDNCFPVLCLFLLYNNVNQP